MKTSHLFLVLFLLFSIPIVPQNPPDCEILITPLEITGLPGLHSYAFAQHDGKWLVIGGRKDGLHARQPFNAFPASHNNTDIYVVDVDEASFWTSSLNPLPVGITEQLQSTNMNFYQDGDTLYIIGGYAYSQSADSYKTFANLTSVQVPGLIDAIISGDPINTFFKQIDDENFAVTGGQLGKIGNTFLLVGGHKFNGRYNAMGMPSYTQAYTNQIRKFTIDNSGEQLSYGSYVAVTDPIHLRRRDYNLLPQIFPDGGEGYTISSGVFQINADLPFLYPVDIKLDGYLPITDFNQYLSNYHSAKVCLYDSIDNQMHSLFFGGISQYYYNGDELIQDDLVPFVSTISRLSRSADGSLHEYQFPSEMPALVGASAEFIINKQLPHYPNEVIKLNALDQDTIHLGYIFGGIYSPTLNPFASNQTNTTSADPTIYSVSLIKSKPVSVYSIDGSNPLEFDVSFHQVQNQIRITYYLPFPGKTFYFLTSLDGRMIRQGELEFQKKGENSATIEVDGNETTQALILSLVFDNRYYATKKLFMK
jgi:hypothetical protein